MLEKENRYLWSRIVMNWMPTWSKPYKILISFVSYLDQILTRLHELEEKTRNESRERALLIDENKKMAAEINQLKSTVITLKEDNDRVLTLLDAKQNAWIEVEAKKRSNISPSKSTTTPVENRFEAVSVEDHDQSQVLPANNPKTHEKIDTQPQLNAYRSKQKEKFAKSKNGSA